MSISFAIFIPVSSLKDLGHSIYSERRVYLHVGNTIQTLQNDTMTIITIFGSWFIQPTRAKLLCVVCFHPFLFISKTSPVNRSSIVKYITI